MGVYFLIFRANLLSAMEYRAAFFIQVVSMMINNSFILFVWYAFFQKFPTIGGLDFGHYSLLQAMMGFAFGVEHLLFAGGWRIASKIRDGGLDSELLLPWNPLLRILTSIMDASAVGDVAFSIIVFWIFYPGASFLSFVVFLLAGFLGAVVISAFVAFVQSLTFFLGDTDELSGGVFELVLSPAMYPPKILENFSLKFLFYSVIPTFFVVWLPAELTASFSWKGFAGLAAFAASVVALAFFTFRRGLRRYESGNLVSVRR